GEGGGEVRGAGKQDRGDLVRLDVIVLRQPRQELTRGVQHGRLGILLDRRRPTDAADMHASRPPRRRGGAVARNLNGGAQSKKETVRSEAVDDALACRGEDQGRAELPP